MGYRVAYPGQGNARAHTRDRRVEHPRLSYLYIYLPLNLGVVGINFVYCMWKVQNIDQSTRTVKILKGDEVVRSIPYEKIREGVVLDSLEYLREYTEEERRGIQQAVEHYNAQKNKESAIFIPF